MHYNQYEATLAEISNLYESGNISKEEYVNLLQGLQVEDVIAANAEEMQKKEQLNMLINAAITAASMAA